jgi:hypothetical protein
MLHRNDDTDVGGPEGPRRSISAPAILWRKANLVSLGELLLRGFPLVADVQTLAGILQHSAQLQRVARVREDVQVRAAVGEKLRLGGQVRHKSFRSEERADPLQTGPAARRIFRHRAAGRGLWLLYKHHAERNSNPEEQLGKPVLGIINRKGAQFGRHQLAVFHSNGPHRAEEGEAVVAQHKAAARLPCRVDDAECRAVGGLVDAPWTPIPARREVLSLAGSERSFQDTQRGLACHLGLLYLAVALGRTNMQNMFFAALFDCKSKRARAAPIQSHYCARVFVHHDGHVDLV